MDIFKPYTCVQTKVCEPACQRISLIVLSEDKMHVTHVRCWTCHWFVPYTTVTLFYVTIPQPGYRELHKISRYIYIQYVILNS